MRNINDPQLKPSISIALKHNTSFSQEPASTQGINKREMEIIDAKYAKADLPAIVKAIVKDNCKRLTVRWVTNCDPYFRTPKLN